MMEANEAINEMTEEQVTEALTVSATDSVTADGESALMARTAKAYSGIGPKLLYRAGYMQTEGWREGFTKPTLEDRKKARRAKNKKARKSRARHKK